MTLGRVLPLMILIGLIIAAFSLGLGRYLTLDALRENREALLDAVMRYGIWAGIGFVLAYAGVVALSLPGATIMTLAGGFLFGVPLGASLTVVGATLGATALFVIARSAVGDALRQRAGPFLGRMADGFSRNAFNYLLFLRLVPAFPFWAVNLAPALLGMRLVPFVIATAIGIIPGTVVYSAFGASLGNVFDAGGDVHPKDVLSPTLIAALVGLGVLALLPVFFKRGARKEPPIEDHAP
ncbi:MAG: TVP38/TMEM64 family protein [Hyphomicrobium sp.]|uniref:TVP38/TMEM64 family protein n=1 Tax=Hyphomicrobium sp. TaxID=82 RepID=UPI00132B0D26|nr:TVP38/TMEM64 family protein [Hyphomicrobium sp.]KAB2943121.1 MAG: TVP38/TMEM64 family protein [Hyphomicrobium sp.]MBZ0209009.1 TVP38/TMEM64 family protein [Hyphomicrobium sp.]